jgi:hypothetical protein
MSKWYIVKCNWPQVDQAINASSVVEKFSGLGGNIWPLDLIESSDVRKMQLSIDRGRCYLDIGESHQIYVITDYALSEKYYELAKEKFQAPLFLELSIAGTEAMVDGYDFGNPEGGFSIIETEILCRQNYSAMDKYLNKHNGLFNSINAMNDFLDGLDEVEELDNYWTVGIRHIK